MNVWVAEIRIEADDQEWRGKRLIGLNGLRNGERVGITTVGILGAERRCDVDANRVGRRRNLAIVSERWSLVVESSVTATDARLAAAEDIPGKAQTRVKQSPRSLHPTRRNTRISGS